MPVCFLGEYQESCPLDCRFIMSCRREKIGGENLEDYCEN